VAAVILVLVYFLSVELGLPSWVFQALSLVTVVQIAVLMLTTRVEQAGVRPRRLNRKRIGLVGAMLVGVVGLTSALYMAGHALGVVGPGRTLTGVETPAARERIILVDFANRTSDSLLGAVATEAFRIDFGKSRTVTVMEPEFVTRVLRLMEKDPLQRLTLDLAKQVAIREGIAVVLAGEITAVGNGYMLTARVISAEDGSVLAAERVSASSSDDVMDAIDRLSERTRARIGESLRTNRARTSGG
jgi:TolB-like protein